MSVSLAIPTLILLAGVIDDLFSKKIHNWLTLTALVVALIFQLYAGGWETLKWGLLGLVVALAISLPMVLSQMLGAGDMKLLMVFGLATGVTPVIKTVVFSLAWGALLGIFQSLFKGEIKSLLKNTIKIASLQKVQKTQYHTIPYTVALFFGWLTHISLNTIGFRIW